MKEPVFKIETYFLLDLDAQRLKIGKSKGRRRSRQRAL
jgi:hypothetical protein